MSILAALAAVGGSFMSQEQNRKEASKQRGWAEEMSAYAHQREVQDLKHAGLNPILSAGGSGAKVGSGSSAASIDHGKNISEGIKAGSASSLAKANVANTNAQGRINSAQAKFDEGAVQAYEANPAFKKTLDNANAARKAGLSPNAGAVVGLSSSGVDAAKKLPNSPTGKRTLKGDYTKFKNWWRKNGAPITPLKKTRTTSRTRSKPKSYPYNVYRGKGGKIKRRLTPAKTNWANEFINR